MAKPDQGARGARARSVVFCLAIGTDWEQARVTLKTVGGMVEKAFFTPNGLVMYRGRDGLVMYRAR